MAPNYANRFMDLFELNLIIAYYQRTGQNHSFGSDSLTTYSLYGFMETGIH